MSIYSELQDRAYEGVEMGECFFAFNKSQLEEGVREKGLEGKKLYRAGNGLYGTDEGIKSYMERRIKQIEDINSEIAEKCSPQEVYDYEFANHECEYVCDDEEAIKIVVSIFGADKSGNEVERRHAYYLIPNKEYAD
jgi:hypothetical protein